MEEKNYEAIIEAILFTMGESVDINKIANALEIKPSEVKKIVKETNTALLLVSHNMGVISLMTDKALVMKDGKCVEQNLTENIFNYPTMTYTKELINAMPKLRKKVV